MSKIHIRGQNNSIKCHSQGKNTKEYLNIESTYTNFTPCNLHSAEIKLRTYFRNE